MSECTISNCSFFNANLSEVNFSNARFYFNNFDNTDFTDTNLDGVKVYAPSNTTDWIAFLKSRVKAGETYLENNFYSEEIGFEEIDPKNAEFYKKYAKLKAFIIKRKTQNNT